MQRVVCYRAEGWARGLDLETRARLRSAVILPASLLGLTFRFPGRLAGSGADIKELSRIQKVRREVVCDPQRMNA